MEFDEAVYRLVKKIPAGQICTYGQIARKLGNAKLSRAVGWTLNRNQNFYTLKQKGDIPCHRVIKSDGFLGGFNQGKKRKIKLLRREGVKIVKNKFDLGKYLFAI